MEVIFYERPMRARDAIECEVRDVGRELSFGNRMALEVIMEVLLDIRDLAAIVQQKDADYHEAEAQEKMCNTDALKYAIGQIKKLREGD